MSNVLTAGEYYERLRQLLARCTNDFTDEEHDTLRTVVRERRNGRRGQVSTPASAAVNRQVDEIVQLLESAARVLRPRQTQELDDLVAGKEPVERQLSSNYAPVRLHRRGMG